MRSPLTLSPGAALGLVAAAVAFGAIMLVVVGHPAEEVLPRRACQLPGASAAQHAQMHLGALEARLAAVEGERCDVALSVCVQQLELCARAVAVSQVGSRDMHPTCRWGHRPAPDGLYLWCGPTPTPGGGRP